MRAFDDLVVGLVVASEARVRRAEARVAAADRLLGRPAQPQAPGPSRLAGLAEPTLPRALAAWSLSWPASGLSFAALALARSIAAAGLARDRPGSRPRDGPA